MNDNRAVLVIDDHPVTHIGCRNLLIELGYTTILEAYNCQSGLLMAQKEKPVLIIIDLNLPGRGGLALIEKLAKHRPSIRLLAFTMHDDPIFAAKSLEAGAHGFLTKSSDVNTFNEAIRKIMNNDIFLENKIATHLAILNVNKGTNPLNELTRRELQILQLIGQGASHHEMAEQLCVSYKTVANSITKLKNKLGVKKLPDLMRIAIEHS